MKQASKNYSLSWWSYYGLDGQWVLGGVRFSLVAKEGDWMQSASTLLPQLVPWHREMFPDSPPCSFRLKPLGSFWRPLAFPDLSGLSYLNVTDISPQLNQALPVACSCQCQLEEILELKNHLELLWAGADGADGESSRIEEANMENWANWQVSRWFYACNISTARGGGGSFQR